MPRTLFKSALALALAAAALLSACSRPESAALRFSTWGSLDEIETLKPLLAEFERENPDVPVELVHIPDKYAHKVRLMAASNQMPDVLFMDNLNLAGFAKRGVLKDLRPLIEADEAVSESDFYRPVLEAMSFKGTLYGIPRDLSNLVIFYNKDHFDEAKLPYPKAGWTYEDMVAYGEKLTRPGERWAFGFQPFPLFWMPFLWSDGVDLMDADMTRSTLLEPETLQSLQRYADLKLKYGIAPKESEVGNARASQLFAQGKVSMMVNGRWVVPGFRKKLTFGWDVAPFPRGKAGSVVDADASGWCIAESSDKPEAAWRLIRFLSGKKAITAFTESGLIVPSRPDVAESAAFFSGLPENSQVFLDVIAESRPTLAPPSYNEIQYELIDGLPPAWDGRTDLKETLEPIAQRIDALLREDNR